MPARPRWSRLKIALVLIVVFLLLAGVATATYLAVRDWGGGPCHDRERPEQRSRFGLRDRADGRVRMVRPCPTTSSAATSSASPGTRRQTAGLSLDEIGGTSLYVGLHVIDTLTGKDIQIPPSTVRSRPKQNDWPHWDACHRRRCGRSAASAHETWPGLRTDQDRLLVYRLKAGFTSHEIYIVNTDGSHRVALPTEPEQHMALLVTGRHPDRLLDR